MLSRMGEKERVAWIDVARGMAIILVVLHHSVQNLQASGWDLGPLDSISSMLSTFRMPLFFAVSGILAGGAIARYGFTALLWKRVALLVYIYVLWTALWWVWFQILPRALDTGESEWGIAGALLVPAEGLWFVYALSLYICAAWVMRRLPAWTQVAIAVVVSFLFASEVVPLGGSTTWRSVGTFFAVFIVASLCRDWIIRTAQRGGILAVIITGAVTAVGAAALVVTPFWAEIRFIFGFAGAAFGITLAVILTRFGLTRRPFAAVGRRTLPIYVSHTPLITAMISFIPAGFASGYVLVPVLTVSAVLLALGIYMLLRRVDGIYTLPLWLSRYGSRKSEAPVYSQNTSNSNRFST